MNRKVRVGVIGLQGFGFTYFQTLEHSNVAEIIAVCDLNESLSHPIAEKYHIPYIYVDYKEMLKNQEIDAVFIATPHFLHYDMTMDALRAGKHVLCEKPLAITSKDAYEMAAFAKEKGLLLSCDYNRRETCHVKMIHDLIQKDALGEIYSIKLKWMSRHTNFMFDPNSGWRISKAKAGGGILIGRGSHMLDAGLFLMGNPKVKSVRANVNSKLSGFEVDDYAFLAATLENGALLTVECSYLANLPAYANHLEYEILGTKASICCAETDGKATCRMGYCKYPTTEWVDLSGDLHPENYAKAAPISVVDDFVEAVHDGREPLVTGDQAALITDILETAYRSSDEQKELPLSGREC